MPDNAAVAPIREYELNCGPGPANITLFHILPLGGDRSLEVPENYYYLSQELTADIEARQDYANNVITLEHNNICEAVQRGLGQRGYNQVRFIVDREHTEISEHAVRHFHTLLAQALNL